LLSVVAAVAVSQSAVETSDLWGPVLEDVNSQLARLDKSTTAHSAHATCQFSIHKELVDYETAKEKCTNSSWIGFATPGGRQLVSIHSELENRIATYLFQHAYGEQIQEKRYEGATNWAWIGLEKENGTEQRPAEAGKLVWNHEDWRWVDGQKFDQSSYSNWMDKGDLQVQPDMMKSGEDHQTAARLFRKLRKNRDESGMWDDTFKSQLHPYICKFNVPVHYIVFPEGKTWHEAKTDCEVRGFYFAKIRNKAENELFVEAARRAFDEERHERKFHHFNWIWIGATDLKNSGTFEYYDEEEIKFTIPWAHKQHDNKTTKKQGSQDYVAVSRWGEWDDSYGDDWKRPYACQCNPQGIAIDQEMERINEEWENQTSQRDSDKEQRRADKEARKEERRKKKEERKADKAQKKADKAAQKAKNQEDKAARKEAKKADKKAQKDKNQEAKADRKDAKKADKAAQKAKNQEDKAARKEAKKAEKKAQNADNKEAKVDRKEAKKAEKSAKKEASKADKKEQKAKNQEDKASKKASRKAEKQAKKADKKLSKAERKANKKAKNPKGDEQLEKRQWVNFGVEKEEEVEKRQWANFKNKGGEKELEKRQWANFKNKGEEKEVEKRQWADYRTWGGEKEVEKRELPVRGGQKRSVGGPIPPPIPGQ